MDIIEFFNSNGIIIGEENFPKGSRRNYKWDVDKQISLIIEVQKIIMGKKMNVIPRIESSIGREIESFIVQTKKISKMISILGEKSIKNDFDFFILEVGNKILKRADKSIHALNEEEYLKIILRSMSNYEICLGRVDEGSLKKEELTICLRTIRYISYNMIEHDCYNYIKRLRKKGVNEDISCIIKDFSYKSNLDVNSINYITLLANYPIESTKILLKLKYDRDRFTNDEWVNEIEMAQNIDGIELL